MIQLDAFLAIKFKVIILWHSDLSDQILGVLRNSNKLVDSPLSIYLIIGLISIIIVSMLFSGQFDSNRDHYMQNSPMGHIRDNEQALDKALQNIADLQDSLAFMIRYNTELKEENDRLKQNQESYNLTVNKEIAQKDKVIKQLNRQNEEVTELLEESKTTLIDLEMQLKNAQDEISRKENIIQEQKKAYINLQTNYMNNSVSQICDNSSMYCNREDLQIRYDLERQVSDLEVTIKRYDQQLDKERARSTRFEKQNAEFKKWMASLVGMQKIVDGSEKIVMKEISQRILPS